MFLYTIIHCISGRRRLFAVSGWAEVEQALRGLGLDPDDWDIHGIEAVT